MKKLLFSVLLLLMTAIGAVAQETLMVCDGTATNNYIPFYGSYVDTHGCTCEFVIPAETEGMSDMEGGTISSLTFYISGSPDSWGSPIIKVYMGEVDGTTLSSISGPDDFTLVYTGTVSNTNPLEIELDETYTYGGGNLFIGTYVETASSTFKSTSFYGVSAPSGSSIYHSGSSYGSASAQSFLPKTTFAYTPGATPTCSKVNNLVADNLTSSSADITWEAGGSETAWVLKYGPAGFDVETEGVTKNISGTPTFQITELTANTAYSVYVKAVCGVGDESAWKSASFRTACGAITSFPWSENFESYNYGNFTAPCWVNEHISGDGTSIFKVNTSTNGSNSTHQLQLPDMDGGTLTKLVLPEMNFGEVETAYIFSIDVYRSNSTYNDDYISEGVRVFASTNGNIEGATEITFIPREYTVSSAVVPAEDAVGWYTYELNIPITTGTCFIILQGESQYCTSTYMDNFVVKEAPSCLKPTALSKSNVTARTVDLSWTAGGTETAWQICLNDNEGTIIDVNTNSYTLTGLTPETAYNVKVRAKCSESDFSEWTSNISFTTTVACPVPTALAYADVTTNSVVLSWTAGGSETAWQICINNNEDDLVDVTENPYTLTGLTPATTYSIKVRANCGDTDGNSQWTSAVSFTTECEALAVDADHPYTEGFEDVTGSYAIPTCWERIIEYTSYSSTYPYVATNSYYTTYSHGGNKALYMYTSSYSSAFENLIALPMMNGINTLQISLWAKAGSTIPEAFEIGYIKNGVFTSVKSVTLTTSYQPIVAYLNEAPADAERIAIRAYHSTTSITVYVDDIEVSEMPTCITPENLLVSNITTASASVAWTDVLPATAWQYQLNDGDIENVDAKPINLTGLTANTEYTIKVRTVCGENENSDWAEVSFTTLCDAVAEFPWIENFNSLTSGIPSCWDNSEGTTATASYRWNYYATGHEGAGLRFNSFSNTNNNTNMLKTVSLDLTELTSAKLGFWYKNPTGGDFSVYVSTDGGATYMTNVVATDLTGVANWTNATYDISSYCGNSNVVIVFVGTSNYGNGDAYIYLDDVIVRPISTAAEILTYTLPTEAAPATFTSGDNTGTIDITVTNSTNFDADLNPTYTISDYAEISAPVITGDGDSRTIRYTVTAEAGNHKDWTVNVTKVPVSRDAFITGFTFVGQKAGTTAEIESNTESNTYSVNAVAEWNVDLTSIAPEITVSPAAEITPESGYARDFTSPVTYTVTAEDGTTFHIYNVTIINDPYACVNPTAVNANDITDATATLSWAQAYTETSYIVKVSTEEMTNMAATADVFDGTVYATTKALENLTANTQYFVYVQSNCDNAEDWTEYSFRTECGVFAVPFVETFEDDSDSRQCWTIINVNDDNKTWIYENGSAKYPYHGSNPANDWLISPKIAVVEGAYLTFKYKSGSSSWPEKFSVYVMDNPDNYETATQILTTQTVTVTTFTPIDNIDLTSYAGQDIYVGIWCESDANELNLYIDDFKVKFPPFTIAASAGANGSISQDGNVEVEYGESQSFTITPDECYHIASVIVDDNVDVTDAVIAANGVYTFADVTANHTIAATFAFNTYNITTSVVGNGTITESCVANCGENKSFTIQPQGNCYRIASFTVDGVDAIIDLDENGVYAMQNITADHELVATFEQITYTITATAGENGTITETSTVNCGDNKEITITPANCYRIASVLVDDVDVTATVVAANGVYTFENVIANHNIAATFAISTYNITATAGEGGSITANDGNGNVANCGENKAFTITANEGYRIASVIVDETENVTEAVVAADGVYTFENVTADHTISATFERVHTISAGTGADGSITPEGIISVLDGESQTFTITPVNECFRIGQVMVDGVDVTDEVIANNGVYTFENVTENHNIVANFDAITLTITATAGEGGTITHNADYEMIPCASNESYTIVANEGYRIVSVIVDEEIDVTNEVIANNGVYTFTNVRANHTIAATFELIPANTYTITATAGENGTITPNGEVTVYEGDNQDFTIEANEGYGIASVMVDETENVTNELVAGDGVFFFTFTNVTANHTINATFELIPTYTITVNAGENGTVLYNDALVSAPIVVTEGATPEFEITPATGYQIDVLTVGENTIELTEQQLGGFTYTFEPVMANITLTVTFKEKPAPTYTITATAGENGTITPNGELVVNEGATQAFTIAANEGYRIASVMVDETENVTESVIAAEGVYTFENVTANHTIAATFETIPTYTITATAGEGGSINPAEVTVVEGGNAAFTIEAATGYHIVSVIVDAATENEVDVTTELVNGVYTFANVTANHTINATFAINTYTITATAGENGTITPNDEVVVNYGATQTFSISANDGYRIMSVLVDGTEAISELVDGVYTFTNVTANHTIAATFVSETATTHTITATAGENGTITPAGAIEVVEGESKSFTIEAAAGYHIVSVMVDETENVTETVIAADGVYTFENVSADHTIAAVFAINTYTITATAGDNGTITPAEATVNYGASQEITIIPNEGYRIESVIVDETEDVTEQLVEGVYTFVNVTANHAIHATFEAIPTYTITATANEGGSINPAEVTVVEGGNASFTITANEGFRIVSVMVDENANVTEQLVDGVYTFVNVTANHTIAATFEAIPVTTYTITATAGANGSIDPEGEVTVTAGENKEFTIVANEGFRIASVMVDETANVTELLDDGVYTFENVAANHTIHATFEEIPTYTITVNVTGNGTVTYNEEELTIVTVEEGATPSFVITPDEGNVIASVIIDAGTEWAEDVTEAVVNGVYTFARVTAVHTLDVAFEALPEPETYTITLNIGENGFITYNGVEYEGNDEVSVSEGATPEFVITPAENYQIDVLTVGGNVVELNQEQLAGFTYTFEPVTTDLTFSVTFTRLNAADMLEAGSMTVYPNPNNGMFSIDFSNIEGDATYQIINASGAVVETRDINVMNGETMTFNHDLRPGTYFVRIINGDKVYVEQIVVE